MIGASNPIVSALAARYGQWARSGRMTDSKEVNAMRESDGSGRGSGMARSRSLPASNLGSARRGPTIDRDGSLSPMGVEAQSK